MNENEDRMAAELEGGRDGGEEWAEEPVAIEVRPSATQVVSFRMPLEELEMTINAAKASGESLSEFVRNSIALRLEPATPRPVAAIASGVDNGVFVFQISRKPADANWNEGLEPDLAARLTRTG